MFWTVDIATLAKMNVGQFLSFAKHEVGRFRGNSEGFFKELASKFGAASCGFVEREYARFLKGSSQSEKLRPIFEQITPSKATAAIQAKADAGDLEGALADTLARLEAQSARADAAIAKLSGKASAAPSLEQVGREVITLATHPSPKVSTPIQRGIEKSLDAQAKLLASAEYRSLSPRQKLESLKTLKHGGQQAENESHSQRCEATRDEILQRMKDRVAGKK